MKEQLEYPVV